MALFHHEDDQPEQQADIANVEDAEAETEAPVEVVDPKVAEMAAAMERVTVEEPAKVYKGSAGKTIKVTSNYIRLVDIFPPPISQLLSSDWSSRRSRRRPTSTRSSSNPRWTAGTRGSSSSEAKARSWDP